MTTTHFSNLFSIFQNIFENCSNSFLHAFPKSFENLLETFWKVFWKRFAMDWISVVSCQYLSFSLIVKIVELRRKVYRCNFDHNTFRKVMHRILIKGIQTKMFVRAPCEMMYLNIDNSNNKFHECHSSCLFEGTTSIQANLFAPRA